MPKKTASEILKVHHSISQTFQERIFCHIYKNILSGHKLGNNGGQLTNLDILKIQREKKKLVT
jgi:hypothetical protein